MAAARRHNGPDGKGPLLQRVTDLMSDETLRNGDAVMTQDGLRIFVGSEGSHHDPDDFIKVSETEGLSPREQSAFLSVDAGLQSGPVQAPIVTGRSAADPEMSAGVPIVDPKGAKIRYVGP